MEYSLDDQIYSRDSYIDQKCLFYSAFVEIPSFMTFHLVYFITRQDQSHNVKADNSYTWPITSFEGIMPLSSSERILAIVLAGCSVSWDTIEARGWVSSQRGRIAGVCGWVEAGEVWGHAHPSHAHLMSS